MRYRRIIYVGILIILALLCERAGTADVPPSHESQGKPMEDFFPLQVYLDWRPITAGEEESANDGGIRLARDAREPPREPDYYWYEWPFCLRGYGGTAPASEAREYQADEMYWYEWPRCLRGLAGASGGLAPIEMDEEAPKQGRL